MVVFDGAGMVPKRGSGTDLVAAFGGLPVERKKVDDTASS